MRLYPASDLEGCVMLGDSHLAHNERSGRSLRTNLIKAVGSPLGLAAPYSRHGLRCRAAPCVSSDEVYCHWDRCVRVVSTGCE
jgi:hypothetical protein